MGTLIEAPSHAAPDGTRFCTQATYYGVQGLFGCYTYCWIRLKGEWLLDRIVDTHAEADTYGRLRETGTRSLSFTPGLTIKDAATEDELRAEIKFMRAQGALTREEHRRRSSKRTALRKFEFA
jgi:hypothetical protein